MDTYEVRLKRSRMAGFLDDLANVFECYPEAQLFYTTADDGVHAALGTERVHLGFSSKDLIANAQAAADSLRKLNGEA